MRNWLAGQTRGRVRRAGAVALACLFALTSVVWAQGLKRDERTPAKATPAASAAPADAKPATAAGEPAADEEKDRVHVEHADQLRYDAQKKQYVLTGHVVFKHKDTTLYCDKSTYDDDNNTAEAEGSLRVIDPDNDCTGDHIHADFNEKPELQVMIITGNVVVVHQKKEETPEKKPANGAVKAEAGKGGAAKAAPPAADAAKPGDEGKEPRKLEDYKKKKTIINADKVEYHYNEDVKQVIATAERTGQVKAVQEDKTCWSDKAVYDEIPDIITVTGNVHVKTEKGDEFNCPKAVISVKDDWIQAEGVTGVALNRHKKKTETPAPPAPGPGSSAPTPAPTPVK